MRGIIAWQVDTEPSTSSSTKEPGSNVAARSLRTLASPSAGITINAKPSPRASNRFTVRFPDSIVEVVRMYEFFFICLAPEEITFPRVIPRFDCAGPALLNLNSERFVFLISTSVSAAQDTGCRKTEFREQQGQ